MGVYRRAFSVVSVLASLLVLPAAAGATTYYAAPTSTRMTGCTTPQTACEIHYAIGTAPQAKGDQVVVLPGTYDAGSTPIVATVAISIRGQVGQPMPEIDGSTNTSVNDALLVLGGGQGTSVSGLKLVQSGTINAPAGVDDAAGNARLDRLYVEMTAGTQAAGVQLNNGTVLSDSVVWAEGRAPAVEQLPPGSSRVENVTANASNDAGILAMNDAVGTDSVSITVENSIVHGAVDLETASPVGSPASISVGYSNFATTSGAIDTSEHHNQSAPPVLVNPAEGFFEERRSSPTIDAGIASTFIRKKDLPGHSRVLGEAPDIGAYEFVVPKLTTGKARAAGRIATLKGTVNPEGLPLRSCTFQYGTTAAYGSRVSCAEAVGSGLAPVAVSAQVNGLQPGQIYHYRLVAADVHGKEVGADGVFTMPRPPAPYTAPHITGGGLVGTTLTCSPGTWTGHPRLAFSWLRDGRRIRGARGKTYTVSSRDIGSALRCRVSATNNVGTSTAVSNAVDAHAPGS